MADTSIVTVSHPHLYRYYTESSICYKQSHMLGPRTMGRPDSTLHHRSSTKLLVSKFEAMQQPVSMSVSVYPNRSPKEKLSVYAPGNMHTPPRYNDGYRRNKDKEKSPIRQSLRNLLSVLKKGTGLAKRKSEERLQVLEEYSAERKAGPNHIQNQDHITESEQYQELHGPSKSKKSFSRWETNADRTRASLSSRSILYLVVNKASLRWVECRATLTTTPPSLTLTWHGTTGPCIQTIALMRCADVRSLSSRRLDSAGIPRVCAADSGLVDTHVFEILFEGKERERFAVTSVRERAAWISAIWDTVLPSQGIGCDSGEHDKSPAILADAVIRPVIAGTTPTSFNTSSSERTLPLLPPSSPPKLEIPSMAISSPLSTLTPLTIPHRPPIRPQSHSFAASSVYPPTPPALTPRTSSPSITNLGRMSMVSQRLAQMEQSRGSASPIPVSPRKDNHSGDAETLLPQQRSQYRFDQEKGEAQHQEAMLDSVATRRGDEPFGRLQEVGSHSGAVANPSRVQTEAYLSVQIASLSEKIHAIPHALEAVRSVVGGTSGSPTLYEMVAGLDHRIDGALRALETIQNILRGDDGNRVRIMNGPLSEPSNEVLDALQKIHVQLSSELPAVRKQLEEMRGTRTVGCDEQPKSDLCYLASVSKLDLGSLDVAPVHSKLDELLTICSKLKAEDRKISGSDCKNAERLDEIISLVGGEINMRKIQSQQQADSVRYLNELNGWLEAFVNNGTSQIQGLAVSIEHLRRDLNSTSDKRSTAGESLPNSDVRNIENHLRSQNQSSTALQTSVNEILKAVANQPRTVPADAMSLIERQRQEQDAMLRAFTNNISNEIKGERLRFVEAMKEATAINVQQHVELLRKELTQEVMGVAEEVGRLHQEKKTVESQIAELVSYYNSQQNHTQYHTQPVTPQGPISRHSSGQTRYPDYQNQRRSLPQPHRR